MFTSIGELLRSLFLYIDKIIYRLAGNLYELFMEIASIKFFSDDSLVDFATRVYGLLAIFMLFKLSFSILTYIVNPDSISDKSTGAGKIVVNILITIIMLISVPWIFTQAFNIQSTVLKENIIGKIILGTPDDESITYQFGAGYEMGWITFSTFFYPIIEECADVDFEPVDTNKCCARMGDTECKRWENLNKGKYVEALNGETVNAVANDEAGAEVNIYEYNYGVSTLAGAFICYMLLLFCIQIATRTVKIGFLQLIAPVPIISYLDPKQGKDGIFKKWLGVCAKTYADLFIRIAAVYFALFIIMQIGREGSMTNIVNGQEASTLAKILIMIGALTFAKDLPKFIEEILGVKLDGNFSLNPFKNNALLGGLVGGAVGASAGAIGGFAGNLMAGNKIQDALRGGFKGFASGGLGGIKDKGINKNTFTRGTHAGVQTGTNYANWRASGSKFGGRVSDRVMTAFGAKTKAEQFDDQIKAYDDIASLHKSAEDYVVGELAKDSHIADATLNVPGGLNYTKADGTTGNIASGTNLNVIKEKMSDTSLSAEDRTNYGLQYAKLKDHLVDNYMLNVAAGRITDGAVTSFISQADAVAKQNDIKVKSVDASSFRSAKKTSKQEVSAIKGSSKYQAAKANQAANQQAKANK